MGAFSWMTTLPIRANGFSWKKKKSHYCEVWFTTAWFTDFMCLWSTFRLWPDTDVWKRRLYLDETMTWGTSQLRFSAKNDVAVEPILIPLKGERLGLHTPDKADDTHVDVNARGCCTREQRVLFLHRAVDLTTPCHRVLSVTRGANDRNEPEDIREYEDRIQDVEQGSCPPLIVTSGGMSSRAKIFRSWPAELMADKKKQPRSSIVAWMRCRHRIPGVSLSVL